MRTTIVSGLLGSGKTTFIAGHLRAPAGKTVVLVNDFGAAGIDGEILAAAGAESVELPSGCVCCTLRFDLVRTIQRIVREHAPEHLVIEPSGVAAPSGVLEALADAGAGPATVVGIVDAGEFAELYESGMYGSFLEDQVRNADLILVNKTDLAEEAAIAGAERLLASLNPGAVLLRTVRAAIPGSLPPAPAGRKIVRGAGHPHFETLSLNLPAGVDPAAAGRLFEELARGRHGRVVRAKALLSTSAGPLRLDLASGRVERERFGSAVADSRLVVIGEGLDRPGIAAAFALPEADAQGAG